MRLVLGSAHLPAVLELCGGGGWGRAVILEFERGGGGVRGVVGIEMRVQRFLSTSINGSVSGGGGGGGWLDVDTHLGEG